MKLYEGLNQTALWPALIRLHNDQSWIGYLWHTWNTWIAYNLHTHYICIVYWLHTIKYRTYKEYHECLNPTTGWLPTEGPRCWSSQLMYRHLQQSALTFLVSQEAQGRYSLPCTWTTELFQFPPQAPQVFCPSLMWLGLETAFYTHRWWLIIITPARLDKNRLGALENKDIYI